ncbi:MAG: hypothetical protein HYX89_00590, partial [Chloroflexi bacterium]|nr:hypothetical protein [Chloroflexota bacterium]
MLPAGHRQGERAEPFWRSSLSLATFVVILAGSLLAILSFQFPIGRYDFREGDVSPYHIRSPIKTTYLSKLATRAEQERAAAAVADIYRYDASVARRQRTEAIQLVQTITAIRDWPGSQAEKSTAIAVLPNTALDPLMADSLVALNQETWQSVA